MKRLLYILLLPFVLFGHEIVIHNRPLVKVNGKNISLIDVKKKMDEFLFRNYPEAMQDPLQCFQYYQARWRPTLDDIINNELMLIEAETREIKVGDADVREEVEARFGPNVMATLDKINLSLDEARALVHTELVVQRILWLHVNQKVYQEVTPQKMRNSYSDYIKKHPPTDQWIYQVLSIRGGNAELCKKIAQDASDMVHTANSNLQSAKIAIEAMYAEEPAHPQLNVSEDYVVENKQLSDMHRTALEDLKDGDFSSPVSQISRATGGEVWRIFHLKERKTIDPPTFDSICDQLKSQLQQECYMHHSQIYFKKLRTDYQLDINIPDDYDPFQLK